MTSKILATCALFALALCAKADSYVVPGTSDPYLAGMPNGSTASYGDTAPAESPVLATGLNVTGGAIFTWSATGAVGYEPGDLGPNPNGESGYVISHLLGTFPNNPENGISDMEGPTDSLLGVFLGPGQPNLSPAPAGLNFSTLASQQYTSLSPQIDQLFFMGANGTGQTIVAPAGATRLFLGTLDGFGWYNDVGQIDVSIQAVNGVPDSCEYGWLTLPALLIAAAVRRRNGQATA
jgi:hypothetical protein